VRRAFAANLVTILLPEVTIVKSKIEFSKIFTSAAIAAEASILAGSSELFYLRRLGFYSSCSVPAIF